MFRQASLTSLPSLLSQSVEFVRVREKGQQMLWSRRTCPFGIPDDADGTDAIIVDSIGHALRAATAEIAEAPLPTELAALLARLQQCERTAQAKQAPALRRRPEVQFTATLSVAQDRLAARACTPAEAQGYALPQLQRPGS